MGTESIGAGHARVRHGDGDLRRCDQGRLEWALLNQESERLNSIYAESKEVNLTPHTKREERTLLVGAQTDLERDRNHIGKPIREIEE
jgi:hypothetical protein